MMVVQMVEKIVEIKTENMLFPIRFVRINSPSWIEGYCQKCGKELGDIVWMAHSTPYLEWECDPEYGEFVVCDSCGVEMVSKLKGVGVG